MNDGTIESIRVFHDNIISLLTDQRSWFFGGGVNVVIKVVDELGELFGGLLVQIGNGDASSQNGVVRMLSGEGSCCLCGQS